MRMALSCARNCSWELRMEMCHAASERSEVYPAVLTVSLPGTQMCGVPWSQRPKTSSTKAELHANCLMEPTCPSQ